MISKVPADVDPADLYEEADFSKLKNGHKERFDRFTGFLQKNGLENVYSHGDAGAAFDARLRQIEFPPAIETWDGSDDGSLRYRFGWLRESTLQLQRKQAESTKLIVDLAKQNADLEKRLAALENRGTAAYRRARRAVGRPVRKMLNGLS
jgi:hypothetical protein